MTVYLSPDDSSFDAIGFDGTESEEHTFEGQLTENAVEDGSNFSDHFILTPQRFSCSVKMTMTPMGVTFEGEGVVLPLALSFPVPRPPIPSLRVDHLSPSIPPASLATLQFPGMPDRIVRQLDLLLRLQAGVVTMTIFTDRHRYDSMVLERISESNTNRWLGAFKLDFKRLDVATTEQVSAPKPKEPRGNPGANKGSQATDPLSQAADNAKAFMNRLNSESILRGAAQSLGLVP